MGCWLGTCPRAIEAVEDARFERMDMRNFGLHLCSLRGLWHLFLTILCSIHLVHGLFSLGCHDDERT